MKFIFEGEIPPYVMAKDMILHVIGDIGVDGATYRAMEFDGEAVYSLNMDERMTLCNMAIEAGGKNGIIGADRVTEDFVKARTPKPFRAVSNDPDAAYHSFRVYQVETLEPTVATPHSPGKKALAKDLGDVKVDQCYIGSCTGGKTTDFLAAAKILKDREVKVKTCVVPSTTDVERDLETVKVGGKTLMDIFERAGAEIGPPSCAACLGGPIDTFGRLQGKEVCISTTNRNFPARMGSKESQVYLASPYTVAASAVTGKITDPREFLS
jgi:3-isopropylmalate/(R)-2-methylmalate dehydratase large subunit